MNKRRFLTVYDYGAGRVWQYIYAENPEQVQAKYPALQVVASEPIWLEGAQRTLREYDIDAEPDEVMAGFTK
jgi:hypothetical protein